MEAGEPLIAPKPGESWSLLQAALAAKKKKKKARRRRQGSHLQWFGLRGRRGQVLSLLAVKPLVRAWSKREGVYAQQRLTGCCLVLKNSSITKSAASARFLLSLSDTFQTQLLLAMLRVKGCSGLPSLSPCAGCQHHLLPTALWRRLFPCRCMP